MTDLQKRYDELLTEVASQALDICNLQQQLNTACQNSGSRIAELASHETKLARLHATIQRIDRHLEYCLQPRIYKCTEQIRTLSAAAGVPIPDVDQKPPDAENQP